MKRFVVVALLLAPALVSGQANLGTYEDRVAVEDVMARYVWTVDSLDADGYVSVFTDDAVIDANGNISRGHAQIRKIVTDLIKRRDDNTAKGLPLGNLYHNVSNVRITFPKPGEALHQSYWQTVTKDAGGRMTAAAMGRSEDHLVKRGGKWLIQFRKLTVFDEAPAPPKRAANSSVTRLFTGADGQSHAEDTAVSFHTSTLRPDLTESASVKVSGAQFLRWPRGFVWEDHPASRRQYVVIVSGRGQVDVAGGKPVPLAPGTVLLAEDTTGKGHVTRVGPDEDLVMMLVPLAE